MTNIDILYEDEHYIAVEKPSGLLIHPYKKETNEKENLLKSVKEQTGHYLYPLHRLDRPVSGIVIFALSSEAGSKLKEIWHKENFLKEYLTLARGYFDEDAGEMNFALSDDKGTKKEARTLYWKIKQFEKTCYLRVEIKTGRHHQIRRHFARRCHGIIGDTTHGKGRINQYFRETFNLNRIFLHAHRLEFTHPYTSERIFIKSELPGELQTVLNNLN